jgi:NADPH2:quinone reductase
MRAVLIRSYGPAADHRIEQVECNTPGAGEILIRVQAVGLNYPDLLMLEGKYQVRHETPFVPGRDAAGIVAAAGPNVTSFRPGDRVMCQVSHGAWAQNVVAPVSRCYFMPEKATFTQAAAMITPYNTAYVAIVLRSRLKAGESAVVTGASGSVGIALIQVAKALGAYVIAAVSSPSKTDFVQRCGADAVILTSGADLKKTFKEQVLAANRGKEADVVFDTVGGEVFAAGLRALGFDGRLIVIGFAGSQIPEVKVNYLLYRNLSVIGAPLDVNFTERPSAMEAGVKMLRELYDRGLLRPCIKTVLPLDCFHEAIQQVSDTATPGRVVLTLA